MHWPVLRAAGETSSGRLPWCPIDATGWPNQSDGATYMVWLMLCSVNDGCELVGLRLPGTTATAFDLVGAVGDVSEELADVLLDLRFVPNQVFAVSFSRIHPQMASSGLKSGL